MLTGMVLAELLLDVAQKIKRGIIPAKILLPFPMRRFWCHVACVLLIVAGDTLSASLLVVNDLPGRIYQVEVLPKADDNFDLAQFEMWVPRNPGRLAGILFVILGSNQDGLQLADNSAWHKLALKWNFALLFAKITDKDEVNRFTKAAGGSGEALLKAIVDLSVKAKHPELLDLPLAAIGFSSGGEFCYSFAHFSPNRVLAFVTIKGGFYDSLPGGPIYRGPALFISGQRDLSFRRDQIHRVFLAGRQQGAPWCLADEYGAGHESGQSMQLIVPFLDAVIRQFHNIPSASKRLTGTPGLLGNLNSHEVIACTNQDAAASRAWLPDDTTAGIWNKFVSGTLQKREDLPPVSTMPPADTLAFSPVPWNFESVVDGNSNPVQLLQIIGETLKGRSCLLHIVAQPPYLKTQLWKSSPTQWTCAARFSSVDMPIGDFHDTIRFRVTSDDGNLFVGADAPLVGRVVGSVKAEPSALVLGGIPLNGEKSADIKLTNSQPTSFTFLSYSIEGPEKYSVSVDKVAQSDERILLRFHFFGNTGKDNIFGRLLIRVKNKSALTVRIPFYGTILP